MPDISITVIDKRPVCTAGTTVVCDNSDYIVHWDLDAEWSAYDSKTMRVIYMDGTYTDTVFTGDSVALPPVPVPGCVQIGLYAGDIHTSRMALLRALSSVRSASGAPANPTPDVYDQLMERMAQLEAPDWNQNDPTAKDYVKNRTHWVEDDGTVHTIDPKYIKDMYYSEIAETVIGYGMNGWAVTTKNEAVPIPKMAIRGKVYENVPVDHTQMANVVYVVGGYTLTFNRMNNYMTTDPSDLSGADVAFYGQGTVYHQMPAWAANLGGQGIYVADTTGSPMVVLDKMPEDCHFVVAINLSPSFTVETVRYRGEDAPIISCKTKKQITNNAIPKYAMLLALTDDGWICVNPIA